MGSIRQSGHPRHAATGPGVDSGRNPLADVTLMHFAPATRLGRDRATRRRPHVQVALAAGRPQLAENLERAAELAAVPDEALLAVYTALRPGRATAAELEEWAVRLEGYGAVATAAFVREAAAAYVDRGLLADA